MSQQRPGGIKRSRAAGFRLGFPFHVGLFPSTPSTVRHRWRETTSRSWQLERSCWRGPEESNGAVQPHGVEVRILLNEPQPILFRQRRSRPDCRWTEGNRVASSRFGYPSLDMAMGTTEEPVRHGATALLRGYGVCCPVASQCHSLVA
jgi:hypothetical protein